MIHLNRLLQVTRLRLLICILCMAALTGCTTMVPIAANPDAIKASIHNGDTVQLTTKENNQLQTYVVIDVKGNVMDLQNGYKPLPLQNITSISRQQIDKTKTTVLIVSVAAGGLLLVGIASAAMMSSMMSAWPWAWI